MRSVLISMMVQKMMVMMMMVLTMPTTTALVIAPMTNSPTIMYPLYKIT